jgi:carbohydrate-selective porin OprB
VPWPCLFGTIGPRDKPAAQVSEQKQSSETSERLLSTEGPSHLFGDWRGLRSWLNNQGVDLDLSYLSESAWDVAGGKARGGTYAGQENYGSISSGKSSPI